MLTVSTGLLPPTGTSAAVAAAGAVTSLVDAVPEKAFYRQIKQNVEPDIWDRSNSDRARDEKVEAVGFDSRAGYGTGPTFGAIKVNNS